MSEENKKIEELTDAEIDNVSGGNKSNRIIMCPKCGKVPIRASLKLCMNCKTGDAGSQQGTKIL